MVGVSSKSTVGVLLDTKLLWQAVKALDTVELPSKPEGGGNVRPLLATHTPCDF